MVEQPRDFLADHIEKRQRLFKGPQPQKRESYTWLR